MLSTRSTIFEIAQLLVDYYVLSSTFSDVCTAHVLLLTLPVTAVLPVTAAWPVTAALPVTAAWPVTAATFKQSFLKLKLYK